MTNRYIVSIGSNSDPELHFAQVRRLIDQFFDDVRYAPVCLTTPFGKRYTEPFSNSAVIFSSCLPPEALKMKLKTFEAQLGRTPEQKQNGIVPIDLDIIVCNEEIIHPDYERFSFVKEAVDGLLLLEKR